VEFRVLGPFEVVGTGGTLALGSAQQRAVLVLLLVRAPQPVSRDRVIDALWGEWPPASAGHAVQVYVSGIRKVLRAGGDRAIVRTSGAGYALEVDPEWIDARRFERLVGEGQRVMGQDPSRARERFEEALGLWRGPPMAEFSEFEFARLEADRLEERHAAAVEGLVEARLECGEHREVIGQLTGLVAANPLRERPRWLMMLALYRAGRHAEALAAYRDACAALDEIGLQPGPELRRLEQAILMHDQALLSADQATVVVGANSGVESADAVSAGASADTPPAAGRAPVEPEDRTAARRKVVSILLCDMASSTTRGEELDPEALQTVMSRYQRELRAVIERHGGAVERFIGDAVMAVFGIPRLHEDDALRAVRAAAEIRERLPAVAEEIGVSLSFRSAVNTGLVLAGEAEGLATGDAVNIAVRLEQVAGPGEILLGEETLRLVRDAVQVQSVKPLELRGTSKPLRAFRLLAVDPLARGLARRLDVPLVGRERELGLLHAAFSRAVQESGCHLFTLFGAAGVGKSRLVSELFAQIGDESLVLSGRCLHYGEGITFWPLIEALSPVGGPADEVLGHLGTGGVAVPEELFFDVRGLLETLASERPVILHIDDLQWAESMLLDLIDHVVGLSRGAPILLLCSARSELLEDHPAWGGGKLNATTALLEPLAAADCDVLLDELGDGLPPGERGRVIAASDGNPLFLEEMAALAQEHGTTAIPPTIHALLAARLERLPVEERQLLERGAIEGEVFHRAAVDALANEPTGNEVEHAIANLVRKELVRPHSPTLQGDKAFRFRHLLIRDAAYDGVPKSTRAELHVRFASWLEEKASELPELDEISGWHLEQAVRYQRELGRDPDGSLAERAAAHLYAAGSRAGARGDVAAATNLLERAVWCASEDSVLRARSCVELADRLMDIGDLGRVNELLLAAERQPEVSDLAELARFEWLIHTEPKGATRVVQARLPQLVERFTEADDAHALARAHKVASAVSWLSDQATATGEQLRLVADYARMAGDGGMQSRALAQYVLTLLYGPQSATTVAAEISAMEKEEDLGPYLAAFLDLGRGELERLEGNFEGARQFTQRAIDVLGALGMGAAQGGLEQDMGQIEISAGNPAAAVRALLRSDAILAELGESALRSTTQALLGYAHARLGDREAACAAIECSERLSAAEDVINYGLNNQTRAHLALADGDAADAESYARTALEYWSRADGVRFIARARLDLARVLSALGRLQDATAEARRAFELYAAKGDKPGLTEAQTFLDSLAARA
jgi:class 3 adenylate cyclase/DNA-binding winged helix-turn-helix (wHTH) protein/tetratricopeptide (TPR) repeat protein